ncbi:MAG TPA: NAD(P)-binding domain-containing protein [Solirubrobacteraceae bacterium]|nr:NAD(P)-binding domain-containing protein [Solirubrobacteraceae bacterium]
MRIGIIGSGNIGATLTRRLTALGHDVAVANSRGPESLEALAGETGASAAEPATAARDADLVIVAVPLRAVPDLPGEVMAGRLVVDANNYYPGRDGQIAAIEGGTPSSRWVADHLSGAVVVKAFNTMNWRFLLDGGRPAGDPQRLALPVAGDDAGAKQRVIELVDELGFDPVDGGPLDESWRQEPGTAVYGANLAAAAASDALTAERR